MEIKHPEVCRSEHALPLPPPLWSEGCGERALSGSVVRTHGHCAINKCICRSASKPLELICTTGAVRVSIVPTVPIREGCPHTLRKAKRKMGTRILRSGKWVPV